MSTGDRLRAAAARVRQGWCQRALREVHSGKLCALGAIGVVECESAMQMRSHVPLVDAIVTALGAPVGEYGVNVGQIVTWNDAPTQTAENVAATLELAAILSDEQDAGKPRIARPMGAPVCGI